MQEAVRPSPFQQVAKVRCAERVVAATSAAADLQRQHAPRASPAVRPPEELCHTASLSSQSDRPSAPAACLSPQHS